MVYVHRLLLCVVALCLLLCDGLREDNKYGTVKQWTNRNQINRIETRLIEGRGVAKEGVTGAMVWSPRGSVPFFFKRIFFAEYSPSKKILGQFRRVFRFWRWAASIS